MSIIYHRKNKVCLFFIYYTFCYSTSRKMAFFLSLYSYLCNCLFFPSFSVNKLKGKLSTELQSNIVRKFNRKQKLSFLTKNEEKKKKPQGSANTLPDPYETMLCQFFHKIYYSIKIQKNILYKSQCSLVLFA